ncbi:MAG TPA: lipid II flippase MurJ, partial [Armatimonadota bacterium]
MSTVAVGATIIAVGTLLSRILGLVRENLLVNTFHDRAITDAFLSAFLVPDMLYYLLAGGALSAAFIPVFAGYLAKDQHEDANRVGSTIANLMLIAVLIGLVFLFIFTPQVVQVIAHGYAPGSPKFNLTVILAREMCAMIIFTALSSLLTGILNSYHHFLMPTVIWNTYNLGLIFGIAVLSKIHTPAHLPAFLHWQGNTLGIHGAALGVLIGALSLVVFQLPAVFKYGFRYAPIIDLTHEGVRRVLLLFAPVVVGLALVQINQLAIPQIIGSILPDGAVTDIRVANRLVLLPLGLFATAISVAAFPRLSQQASLGEKRGFSET